MFYFIPRRYFRCDFISFRFGAVQFLNVLNILILTLLCVQFFFNSVKVIEMSSVWGRAANSAYQFVMIYLSIFFL